MNNKYNMTTKQNILFAKRNLVDSIYKSAKLEGISVTFPETQSIIDGKNVSHLRIDELVTINNLKNAWKMLLTSVENIKFDYNYLCSLNSLIGNTLVESPGNLRYGEVKIGGTNYIPSIPTKEKISKIIQIQEKDNISITEKALTIMCKLMKVQPFFDGNKRTSMLFANSIMIKNGKGIISIPDEKREQFGELLIKYYEDDNCLEELKEWLYENSIEGIVYHNITQTNEAEDEDDLEQ